MLIHLRIRDKRYDAGFKSVFYHEDRISPEIYKIVKKKRDKIISISFGGSYYWSKTSPNISDFLSDYKHLKKTNNILQK